MVVDGLGDGLAAFQRPDLLLHEREVVGARIQRCDPDQRSFAAIERVVVVEAHGGDAVAAEQVVEGACQRRLAAAAVATDADEDGRNHCAERSRSLSCCPMHNSYRFDYRS